jgi:aminopeptidase N
MTEVRIVSLPRNVAFVVSLVAVLVLASSGSAIAATAPKQPSEPFFPRSGNRGYNVKHYDVSLGYQPRSGQLTAREMVEARATSGLRKFSLDLDGLKVTSVSVDGEAAKFSRGRGKVKIAPATPIAKGRRSRSCSATRASRARSSIPTARPRAGTAPKTAR